MTNKEHYKEDNSGAAIAFAKWLHMNYSPKPNPRYSYEWNYNWIILKRGYEQRTTTDKLYQIWENLDMNEALKHE